MSETEAPALTDEAILERTEADLAAARSFELSKAPLKGNFDLAHLRAIHSSYSAMCTNGPGSFAPRT